MDHVLTVVNLASTNLKMFLIIHACLAKKTAAIARQPQIALPGFKGRCLTINQKKGHCLTINQKKRA
jgi:hypothetical protein